MTKLSNLLCFILVLLATHVRGAAFLEGAGSGGAPGVVTIAPGANLYNAKLAAIASGASAIVVGPGTYTNGVTNLFWNGTWEFLGRPTLFLMDIPTNTSGAGIFDDRFSGAVTCNISGSVNLQWCSGTNVYIDPSDCSMGYNTNALGAIIVTNANSLIRWDAATAIQSVSVNSGNGYSLYVENCQTGTVFRTLSSSQLFFPSNKILLTTNCPADPGTPYEGDLYSSFLHWAKGTCDVEFDTVVHRQYGIESYSPTENDTDELRIRGNFMDGKIYAVGRSPDWKIWADILELKRSQALNAGAIETYFAGKHYFRIQKVSSYTGPGAAGAVINLTHPGASGSTRTNLNVWVEIDKLSGSNVWLNVTHGELRGRIGQFEQNGPTTSARMINVTNATSVIKLSGETMDSANSAMMIGGGKIELTGYTIQTTNADPVYAFPASDLSLNAVKLLTVSGTNSISAPSATTVKLNATAMNKPLHANVTADTGLISYSGEANATATSFTPVLIAGVGGANTNFTLQANQGEAWINGFTNVSLRAVMQTDAGRTMYWTLTITNGSGSDRTFEFSAVTNRVRWSGTYGTNAPVTLTNNTQLVLAGKSVGTNTVVGYSYFTWP